MKIQCNWPNGFWENNVLRYQQLIYSHCQIRLNISSENNDFGFNSFQNINFSKMFPFRCFWK